MNYEITRLDNRHSWHTQFRYMIEFPKPRTWQHKMNSGVLSFDRSRRWFNEKFGWSQDVETRSSIGKTMAQNNQDYSKDFNLHWAYSIKYNDYRIYVQGEAELNWFVLSHPRDQNAEV